MFSKAVLATDKKKTTLNWFEYWIGHCWMTGWQTIRHNFRIWCDLIQSNYANYALLKEDDPEKECIEWFWIGLNDDDVYPKEFLEYLMQMVDDIETGKVETVPADKVFSDLEELFDDLKTEEDLEDGTL